MEARQMWGDEVAAAPEELENPNESHEVLELFLVLRMKPLPYLGWDTIGG